MSLTDPSTGNDRVIPRKRLFSQMFSIRVLSLADQAIVSGTSFLAIVLIGRFAHPSELGLYTLAISLLIAAMNCQYSLITLPFTMRLGQPHGGGAEDAGNSLVLAAIVAIAVAAAITVVVVGMWAMEANPRLTGIIATLACVVPFILLRDFSRGYCIGRLQFNEVLAFDIAVSFFQLTALAALAWFNCMSGAAALVAAGSACAVTAATGFILARRDFVPRLAGLVEHARESWRTGKWLLANLLALVTQVQVVYWLMAAFAGTLATGVYAACMSIAGLMSPVIAGLANPMFAKAVATLAEGGPSRLWRQTLGDAFLLFLATGTFSVLILFVGDDVIRLIFPGNDFAGNHAAIIVLAVWQMAQALNVPASNALSIMARSRANFWHGLIGTVSSTVIVLVLVVGGMGSLGAASGLLIGTAASGIVRWYTLWCLLSDAMRGEATHVAPKTKGLAAIRTHAGLTIGKVSTP